LTANADENTFERAKHTRPHAFISKPYKKLDLQRAIELAIGRMAVAQNPTTEIVEKSATESTEAAPYILSDRIFVRHKNRMVKLFLKDILYIEAERSYCRIQTSDTEFLLSMPLRVFAEKLDGGQFFRIHRSYIINLTQIDEVGETHIMVSKKLIPIGKSYKKINPISKDLSSIPKSLICSEAIYLLSESLAYSSEKTALNLPFFVLSCNQEQQKKF